MCLCVCVGMQDERKRHVASPTEAEEAEEADPESLEYLAGVLRNLRGKAQRHVFFTGRPLAAQVRCLVDGRRTWTRSRVISFQSLSSRVRVGAKGLA